MDPRRFEMVKAGGAGAGGQTVDGTVSRLREELADKGIPVFAQFDHAENAREAGLKLRPTTVVVFGSPLVGTGLMQENQGIALELPLRMAVWEDEEGSIWLSYPRLAVLAEDYGLSGHPVVEKMQVLLDALAQKLSSSKFNEKEILA